MASIGNNKKKKWAISLTAVFLALGVVAFAGISCTSRQATDGQDGPHTTVANSAAGGTAAIAEPETTGEGVYDRSEPGEADGIEEAATIESDSDPTDNASEDEGGTVKTDDPEGIGEGDPPFDNENRDDSQGQSPEPEKRWVVDYTSVWVEDSPAWTEQVPVYGLEEHSICNICGADITRAEASHGKQHMMAGQGSGHHNSYVQAIVGYDAVDHPAEGHWETVESGGHWEQ